MHSAKARSLLNELVVALRGWETGVPDRAKRFHFTRRKLFAQIVEAIPFWKLWIGDDVVHHYQERVDRLREVAEPLAQLLQDIDALESDVHRLGTRSEGRDAELTAWLRGRCRDFFIRIGRLAVDCERETDVNRDRTLFANIETDVRFHYSGMNQLIEAERILTVLSPSRAMQLSVQLPHLRERLYADGCTPKWLDDLDALIQPFRDDAGRVEDPPAQVGELSTTLTELGRWSTRLGGEFRQEVEQLEERLGFNVVDWEPAEVQELDGEVQSLRTRILDRVAEVRGAKLGTLEREVVDLSLACSPDEKLEEQLADLRERPFNRPHLFEGWLDKHAQVHHSFRAVAMSNIGKLKTHLATTMLAIDAQLAALESQPLSNDTGNEVVLARRRRRELSTPSDVEEVLAQLHRANEILRELARLKELAEEEVHEIDRRQALLSQRTTLLLASIKSAKGVKIEIADLPAQIATLSDGEGTLEERRQQALRLESALEALETKFVEACRTQLAVLLRDSRRAADVLQRAGVTPQAAESPVMPAGTVPEQAAQTVLDAWRLSRALRKSARMLFRQLEDRRHELNAELRKLRTDDLTPGDREECAHLLRDLDTGAWIAPRALMDRLEMLAALVESCEKFFDRLEQEQHEARERLAKLQGRFRAFTEERLYRHCPALADRVAALIYGVPEQPRYWTAVRHQLDLAGDLFARVEPHAQRLAADELDEAALVLRERMRGGGDLSLRELARKLLDELDACNGESLPPASLRLRIVNASKRPV
jgi:hypothetical protein